MSDWLPQTPDASEFRGWKIPDILLSENCAAIERWHREQAIERTKQRRPDLLPPDEKG